MHYHVSPVTACSDLTSRLYLRINKEISACKDRILYRKFMKIDDHLINVLIF